MVGRLVYVQGGQSLMGALVGSGFIFIFNLDKNNKSGGGLVDGGAHVLCVCVCV